MTSASAVAVCGLRRCTSVICLCVCPSLFQAHAAKNIFERITVDKHLLHSIGNLPLQSIKQSNSYL